MVWEAVYGAVFSRELDRLETALIPLTVELIKALDEKARTSADLAEQARAYATRGDISPERLDVELMERIARITKGSA